MHRFSIFMLCFILTTLLTACNTSDVTLTPVSATMTMPSSTPTPTPIPAVLDVMPTEISDDDLSIVARNIQYHITDVMDMGRIGKWTPFSGRAYLVMRGYIYNYTNSPIEIHDVDFQIDYAGARNVNPNVDLMSELSKTVYKGANYPDCNIVGCKNFILPAKRAREMVLAYIVPPNLDYVMLKFKPGGSSSRAQLGILLFPSGEIAEDQTRYIALKESVNGETTYTLSYRTVDTDSAEVSEIIDTESMVVDNCFGTEMITREIEISTSTEARFEILDEAYGALNVNIPQIFMGNIFEAYARRTHGRIDSDKLSTTRREEVTAAPGTRTKWRLDAYKVSFSGVMVFSVGSRQIEVPYKLADKLRTELVSEPTEPCSSSTP